MKVRAVGDGDEAHGRTLMFEIEGDLWAQPLPLQLYLKTEVDLESGDVAVTSQSGAV